MYNRYNEEIFCFIEKYINVANLVLLFFRREGSFGKGRKDSGTTQTPIQLEESHFKEETVIVLLIYSILLLDFQVHKGDSSQLDLLRYRCIFIEIWNKVVYMTVAALQ